MAQVRPSLATLVARGLRLERGGNAVLEDVSMSVSPGARLGVIGPNGVGKSSLLEVLAGRLEPDGGRVELVPRQASVGYLTQEHGRSSSETVRALLERKVGASVAEDELVAAAVALGGGAEGSDERYSDALERWSALGLDTLAARTETVLSELGLDGALLGRTTDMLSGGQAARVALAAVLLSRFDILLLDEPTNDLDFDGLEHLERFATSREGALVVVSHDRAFLERTVTAVLELDEHARTGSLFEGGWSSYLAERATDRRHSEEAHASYEARRQELAGRARREREWATTAVRKEKSTPRDNDKAQRDFRVNKTEQLAQRARRTERAIERLERVEKPWEGWELRFSIEEAERSGSVVARLDQAVVERGRFRLGPVDLEIAWADRVLLAGRNGSGKTTLVDALLGRISLSSGRRWLGPSVVAGTLDQDRSGLGGEERLLEAFTRRSGIEGAPARSLLAKFGLGPDHVGRPGRSLSPGERTRAELAVFQARGANLLVLDEPTNHLDLPAIEQLEEALRTYSGTLVLVSHDRRLLETVQTTRVVDVEALGSLS